MPEAPSPRRSGALVCALAFTMLLGYAVARPASESLFLQAYGAEALPWAWLTVAITVTVCVGLYSYSEKTRGTALVDMLTYRVAKGVASMLLVAAVGLGLARWLSGLTVVLIVAWLATTVVLLRRHRRLQHEITAAGRGA